MDFRLPALVSLIFLGAAAAAPSDCLPHTAGDDGEALPLTLDLTGRPTGGAGLTARTFATLPAPDAGPGCRTALPSGAPSSTLRSDSTDLLHALPMPEILLPMEEPRRAPLFQ